MTNTFQATIQGFQIYGLRNDAVEIAVMPELGAKVSSLIQHATGREWMWTPPQGAHFFRQPTGSSFLESSIVGADECIPTIVPCQWRGRDLTDHGEVWTEAWTLDEAAFAQGALVTSIKFPISPFWLERRISLVDNNVRFEYTLRNESAELQEFMWAYHPLMKISEGDQLVLPADTGMRTYVAGNCPWDKGNETRWRWPNLAPEAHIERLDLGGTGRGIKLFSDPVPAGNVAIHNARTGEKLTYTFDAKQVDTIGIWLNRGSWNGYQHLAIEPGIGAPDPLDRAVQDWQRFGAVAPGEITQWWFALSLTVEK